VRQRSGEPAGGLDAVQLGHRDVHDDDVGLQLLGQPDGFPAVAGLAGDLHVGLRLQDHPKAVTDHGVIVSQQDADALHD
jgi:hypothetical protein